MSYKKKTPHFGIPYVSRGEVIEEREEERKAKIIENQLLSASNGVSCCVFEDGEYQISIGEGETYVVSLKPCAGKPALFGCVNSGLVYSDETVSWKNLRSGKRYNLCVGWTKELFEDSKRFVVIGSERKYTNSDSKSLLLAIADFTGDEPKLETYPDGKVYGQDISVHCSDKTNPHGRELFQDYLKVLKGFEIQIDDDLEDDASILVDDQRESQKATIESTKEMRFKDQRIEVDLSDDGSPVLKTVRKSLIGAINEVKESFQVCFDLKTGGESGTKIEFDGYSVDFATASVIYNEGWKKTAGEFSFEYGDGFVVVRNSGDKKVPIRVLIRLSVNT